MEELKKYTSFKALKLNEKSASVNRFSDNIFTEYETFLKQLQNEYFNNRNAKTDYDVTKISPKS